MEKTRSWYEKEKIMTLFKQMALAISLMIITILGSVMVINFQSAKTDMIESIYQTTVNNISSLAGKISQAGDDTTLITSIIDAEFDSGYYKKISYRANDTTFKYTQEDNEAVHGVPTWFITLTTVKLPSVSTDVSSGWSIIGKLTVLADSAIVYKSLYKTFIKLLFLFVIFVALSLIILSILLSYILKPLKRIQNQAEAIVRNEFVIETKEPYTTEFKEVSHAMNTMVKKVEEIFNKANEAAKRNRELLYNDPITKLFNRRYLMLKLPELIAQENRAYGGTIMFVALSGAQILNETLGRQEADKFFCDLAEIFKEECSGFDEKLIARVNGTEFTLMLPACEAFLAQDLAINIYENFLELLDNKGIDNSSIFLDIGIYRYRADATLSEVLTRADDALTKAKADERQHIYVYEEKESAQALGKEAWREIIENSISKKHFFLKFWPTLDTNTKHINHKVMTFTINDGKKNSFYYGDFIAPAINLGLVGKIYLVALKELLSTPHKELEGSVCSIRLSNEFLKDKKVFNELSKLFRLYAKTLSFKLYFEVSDTFAINNTATIKGFVDLFNRYKFGFGINSFTGESDDFHYLKELNPEFIKADVSFLLDQSKESLNALEVVTKSLGIEIIATFVKNEEELKALKKINITKIQGPLTEKL